MWTRYLALGDSASRGVGDDVGGLRCRSWTALVADALAAFEPGLRYRNMAARGATAQIILRQQLPGIGAFGPDLVSVTVGANDARELWWKPEVFESQLTSILGTIAEAGAQPLVATYPDIRGLFERENKKMRPSWRAYFERVTEVNHIIRETASRFDACIVDLEWSAAATDPRYLSADFTHPNALGYELAAQSALNALSERTGLRSRAERELLQV